MSEPGPRAKGRRAHLCGCSDPTRHPELRAHLGTAYLAVRARYLRLAVRALRSANGQIDRLDREVGRLRSAVRAQRRMRAIRDAQIRSALERAKRGERYRADNVAIAKENAVLRAALKRTLDLSHRSPVFKGGLGGRTAIESYRGNAGLFVDLMNEVGVRARVFGHDAAELFLMGPVKLDLESLWAAASPTIEEELRRRDLSRKLSVTEEREQLLRPDDVGEKVRREFVSDVASSGVSTSVQELVRRSGEVREVQGGREVESDAD